MVALALAVSCAAAGAVAGAASDATRERAGGPRDPLMGMLHRVDAFLHRGEADGVTLDPRELRNPPEAIRLSVVPQILAYCELHRVRPSASQHGDIVARADFLVRELDGITSRTAADGMLGYALLSAYEITGDARYLAGATTIVQRALALRDIGLKLNWGLMAALALAKYHQLEGDPRALAMVREIVRGVAASQHADGSLPHLCPGSKDVHYTAWMSMELIQLRAMVSDSLIPRILSGAYGFMQRRVATDGVISYEDSAGGKRTASFFGPANGCAGDYDTRGWVNELGYHALLFHHFADARYGAVMERLLQLEDHGAFPDKWGAFPEPSDPIYPWALAERSVIRTSLVFWALAALHADRERRGPSRAADVHLAAVSPGDRAEVADAGLLFEPPGGGFPFSPDGVFLGEAVPDAPAPPADPPAEAAWARGGAAPFASATSSRAARERVMSLRVMGQARGGPTIRFSLPERGPVTLRIYDVAGRVVRELWRGAVEAGEHDVKWDGHDEMGGAAPAGLYVVHLVTAGEARSARLLRLR